jgi:hypothetical protein
MKRYFTLLFALLFASLIIMGQSKKKSHWLMISVYEDVALIGHSTTNILETREDGTQTLTVIKKTPDYALKHFKENEDSIFVMLQPYFADGWKLTATNTVPISPRDGDFLTRYFFCKENTE